MNPNLFHVPQDDLHNGQDTCLDIPRFATWVSFQIVVPPLEKAAVLRILYRLMPDVGEPLPPWQILREDRARPSHCQRQLVISNESLAPFGIRPKAHVHFKFEVPRFTGVHMLFEVADA